MRGGNGKGKRTERGGSERERMWETRNILQDTHLILQSHPREDWTSVCERNIRR